MSKPIRLLPILGLIFSSMLISPIAWAKNQVTRLTLVHYAEAPFFTPEGHGIEQGLWQSVFEYLDIEVHFVELPSERAWLALNAGRYDGGQSASREVSRKYPHILQTREPSFQLALTAYAQAPTVSGINYVGWQSLDHYRLGVMLEWPFHPRLEKVNQKNIMRAKTGRQLFRLLTSGRIDIALLESWTGQYLLKNYPQSTDIQALKPPLAVRPVYLCLHRRHADLIPRIEAMLKQMKQTGEHRTLLASGLQSFGLKP